MINLSPAKIRVLIVDDSATVRMVVRDILASDPLIEVVGQAVDGIDAVEKVRQLRPDVVTLDVDMPRMNGIDALRQIMSTAPETRVIMLSSLTPYGAKITFDALESGAVDYIPKSDHFDAEILVKVKSSARLRQLQGVRSQESGVRSHPRAAITGKKINVVAIGASTGGPVAVQEVLSQIPASFPHPILVAIHMPKAYTAPFAERINSKCAITVREAAAGEFLKPGVALIAPGGMHTMLLRQGGGLVVKTEPAANYPKHVYVPSIDMMISSMAEASGGAMLGVILTGMGSDGFKGMQMLKQKGGINLVQDEATSIIYGMPRACIEGGAADIVLPLNQIGSEIARLGR